MPRGRGFASVACADDRARLAVRLPALSAQIPLLRAELRIWLMLNRAGDEVDVTEILAAATRAFLLALGRVDAPRTLAVEVEASYAAGVVDLTVRDHAGATPNVVHVKRLVPPARR